MPRKVKTVSYYACRICHREDFTSFKAAKKCEDRGIALPEFFDGMVVRLGSRISVGQNVDLSGRLAVVDRDTWIDEDNPSGYDFHRLPCYYELTIASFGFITMLGSECMELVEWAVKNGCPLCGATKISEYLLNSTEPDDDDDGLEPVYSPYCALDVELENVKECVCDVCECQFFTSEQAKVVREQIEKAILAKRKTHIRTIEELEADPEGKYYY